MSTKQEATLNNWDVESYGGRPYLTGEVEGHPELEDGMEINTSYIVRLDFEKNTAETINTNYKLGVNIG
jgi:hypothetical protein